jgi:serine phosphatase RsbU (regulator of sigma subunit)
VSSHLPKGARLLFYTDGLVESRNRAGAFFPLADSAATLRTGTVDGALDGLLRRLADHVEMQVDDDMALLLVEQRRTMHDGTA